MLHVHRINKISLQAQAFLELNMQKFHDRTDDFLPLMLLPSRRRLIDLRSLGGS